MPTFFTPTIQLFGYGLYPLLAIPLKQPTYPLQIRV